MWSPSASQSPCVMQRLPARHGAPASTPHRVISVFSDTAAITSGAFAGFMRKQAAHIAINRTVAGMHFPIDSHAGRALGTSLGVYIASRCQYASEAKAGVRTFAQRAFDADATALQSDFPGTLAPPDATTKFNAPASDLLGWLWGKASEEWFKP